LKFREDTLTFLPENIPNERRLELLRRKHFTDDNEAREFLMRWYGISRSTAYELVRRYNSQRESLVVH
jgi:hypothetical protein